MFAFLERSNDCSLGGSDETITNAIGDRHGFAAVIRHVCNELYSKAEAHFMSTASAVSLSWDAACHGGSHVNVGLALNTVRKGCVHMKPVA
jgi:hypothetical protein